MLPGAHGYHDEAGSHFVVYLLLGIRGCYQGLTATMMKQGSHFVVCLLLGIRGCYQGLTATMIKQGVISLFVYF